MGTRKYEVRTRLFTLRNPRLSAAVLAAFAAAKAPLSRTVEKVRRIEKKR